MIGWLQGKVIDRQHPGKLVLDVQGVGYDVETSLTTFFKLEPIEQLTAKQVSLHIHTLVREDAIILYGFIDKQERELFRALIKVNGVGPKMAMTILSSTTPEEFMHCIELQNTQQLTLLPGIGKKTAERLLIEMRDHKCGIIFNTESPVHQPTRMAQQEALQALEALGYKTPEALKMLKSVDDEQATCEQLIRKALNFSTN